MVQGCGPWSWADGLGFDRFSVEAQPPAEYLVLLFGESVFRNMHLHQLQKIWRFPKTVFKRLVSDLLRLVLLSNRPKRMAQAGFVLPTTVLLALMVVLTATALTYRTFTRSEQAIVQREQQVIANAATPAIDRAKAKIEFLFRNDPRFPSGVPASDILYDLMSTRLETGKEFAGYTGRVPLLVGGDKETKRGMASGVDPYTLTDETRLDINNDGILDNAWSFPSNGQTIVYSILVDDAVEATEKAAPPAGQLKRPYVSAALTLEAPADQTKADSLITRTAPLATTEASPLCKGAVSEGGWQVVTQGNASDLQKNFQVNAFVANADGGPGQTFETLEFQQSRQASRASKWGAWFRYDLEIFPGAAFNWNGAMHTDGNLIINRDTVQLHMVSSHNSCVYSQESSEISLSTFEDEEEDFQGQAVKGATRTDNYPANQAPTIHVYDGANKQPVTNLTITNANHSVDGGKPSDISVNAMALFTQDRIQHMNSPAVKRWKRRPEWDTAANKFGVESGGARIINDVATRPFVDDFYRADDRWGPKPRYDSRTPEYDVAAVSGRTIGDSVVGLGGITDKELGLDGYWERQAIKSGLRIIVGQRLELGNNDTWNKDPLSTATPNPPYPDVTGTEGKNALYPSKGNPGAAARFGGNHEYLQRRSLQDNLAAVQGMVVYHYQGGDPINTTTTTGEFPAACVATTAHPGTKQSIVNSRTFARYNNTTKSIRVDFLNGLGTNGWEFSYPTAFNTEGKFGTQLRSDRPLGIALRNLANFAGDPGGGAPSFKAYQDDAIHPFPYHSMWGDFSPLRRVLMQIDTPSAPTSDSDALSRYTDLSFADKATLHSAACTLSMLAYTIDQTTLEYEEQLKNYVPPKSLQNVTTGGSQIVANITNYLVTRQDPTDKKNYNKYTGNSGADKQIQDALTGLPSGNRNKLWVDPKPSTAVVNPKDGTTVCAASDDGVNFEPACDSYEFFSTLTFDDWVYLLNQLVSSLKPSDITDLLSVRYDLLRVNSLLRDRDLGFRDEKSKEVLNVTPAGNSVFWNPTTGLTDPVTTNGSKGAYIYGAACNPNIFSGVAAGGGGGKDNVLLGALIACSTKNDEVMPVRYPSLFYLFPLVDHGILGNAGTDNEQPHVVSGARVKKPDGTTVIPGDPEYVTRINNYITSNYSKYGATAPTFKVVQDSATPDPRNGLKLIAAEPKLDTDLTKWTLPVKALTGTGINLTTGNIDNLNKAFQIDYRDSSNVLKSLRVPFLDKGLFDGREQLNVRVLDMDVELLTTEKVKTGTEPDYWLTANREKQAEGVIFAFREDAVREDEIVRPKNTSASDCTGMTTGLTYALRIETVDACQMRVANGIGDGGTTVYDPPLTAQGISIKPVDFIADPERRPHGFRLRTFSGNPADFSGTSYARKVGMTLVTDNSLYIQGDFNPHSEDGTTSKILEEFTKTLWNNDVAFGNDFYTKRTKADLNTTKFAVLEVDHWRPVELLSDAITILSKDFKDGAVEDGFLKVRPAAEGGGDSSYMNQNRPTSPSSNLVRSQIETATVVDATTTPPKTNTVPATAAAPPYVDRNGTYYINGTTPFYSEYNTDAKWTNFDTAEGERRRNLQKPSGQAFVNATFVSGIVPKRAKQSYGGLHNYPRFIESWSGQNLFISGSFIQLNFSTGGTGPYEQDAWEADVAPVDDEVIGYYNAPVRRWGYDVGLLYVPPAPAARRFVTIGAPRSEYYRELPADDPYVINLRCAKDKDGNLILNSLCPVEDKA